MTRLTRRVLPLALAAAAAFSAPASANHSPCEAAGGTTITGIGPTNATLCVLISANRIMVGTDVIHQCGSPCTLVGARVQHVAGRPEVCVTAVVSGTYLLDICVP